MEDENELNEERQKCILLLDFIISSMSADVKAKIASEGYTPLKVATLYLIDQIRAFDFTQWQINADNVVDKYESFSVVFVFDRSGTTIVDIVF
ncbi:hypothetical protein [Pedobacter westerhofensis]|nr:hypothetical protein [Pedobacter westerhofensis]